MNGPGHFLSGVRLTSPAMERVSTLVASEPVEAPEQPAMERIVPFNEQHLTSIAKILADTTDGLTGSEIEHILRQIKVPDVSPEMTKWKRLVNALVTKQNQVKIGNHTLMFITRAMNPVQYTSRPHLFAQRRDQLNTVLAFAGIALGEDGQLRRSEAATGLDDALQRASRLHAALVSRAVHADVLTFCRAELLQENYFHAVFEAMKSISSKVRSLSGLTGDGAELVTQAFALGKDCRPTLAINSLHTETDKGEQRGFVNLLVGLFGTIRNPSAHNPKIEWPMPEQDALDILTTVSLIHRKLDAARRSSGT
jgi:uncharacterized protein (TIGR02391 family)